jgi:hypothetical protein
MTVAFSWRTIVRGLWRRVGFRTGVFYVALAAAAIIEALQGPYVVRFIDIQYPYDTSAFVSQLAFAWSYNNLGVFSGINIYIAPSFLPYAALAAIGLPAWFIQASTDTAGLSIAGIGAFWLSRELWQNDSRTSTVWASLLSGVLYMFSMATVQIVFWDFIPIGVWFLALFPVEILLLLRLFRILDREERISIGHISAFLILTPLTLGANEPLALNFLYFVCVILIWKVSTTRSRLRLAASIIAGAVVLLSITLNAFWIVPELGAAKAGLGGTAGYAANLFDFTSFTGQLNLVWALELRGMDQGVFSWYGPLYDSPGSFSVLLLPLALILIIPLIRLREVGLRLAQQSVLVLWLALLGAAAIYTGVNSPIFNLGGQSLFLNPYVLQVVRNSADAVGVVLALLVALLFGFGVHSLSDWLSAAASNRVGLEPQDSGSEDHLQPRPRRRWRIDTPRGRAFLGNVCLSAAVLLVLVPALLPAASGSLIAPAPYQSRTEVPSYVPALATYLNSHAQDEYTLLVPGGFQEQNWTEYGGHGYDGYDILASEISTPIIDGVGGGVGGPAVPLIQDAYSDLLLPPEDVSYGTLLSVLQVHYLVLEGGLGGSYPFGFPISDNITRMRLFLAAQPGLDLVNTFGPDYLYVNVNPAPAPVLSTSTVSSVTSHSINITALWYNATIARVQGVLTSPVTPIRDQSGALAISADVSEQLRGLSFPGDAVSFNSVPLNISLAQFPTLTISFATGNFTAVGFAFSSIANLSQNYSDLSSETLSSINYEFPAGNAIPNPGWYYSPGNVTTVTINVSQVYSETPAMLASNGTLSHFFIIMAPTMGDDHEQLRTNASNLHDLNATIEGIALNVPFYSWANRSIIPSVSSSILTNLTREFYADSLSNSTKPSSPIKPTSLNSSILISVNRSSLLQGLPFPGSPMVFNDQPLQLNITATPYLIVKFETDRFTAVSILVSNTSNLSATAVGFGQDWSSTWQFSTSYPNAVPNLGWYYSPNVPVSLAINLPEALATSGGRGAPASPRDLNFIDIALAPTIGNQTEQLQTNASTLRGENVTVESIELTSIYEIAGANVSVPTDIPSFLGVANVTLPEFDPTAEIVLTGGVQLTDLTTIENLSISYHSPVEWQVAGSTPDGGQTVIVLFQRWDPMWELLPLASGLSVIAHVIVDGYANGWLVNLPQGRSPIDFEIVYTGQHALVTGILVSEATLLGVSGLLIYVLLLRWFPSWALQRFLRRRGFNDRRPQSRDRGN